MARTAMVVLFGLGAQAALAADVSIEGALTEELREALTGGSLLVEQSKAEAAPSPQELVSSAQADYQRLLAVLYDRGYFGGVITIKLDGREAAQVPPVSPPQNVQRAVISVDPGPQFRFGQARIAPVAPGTELPEEFASGQTASLGAMRDATSAGIDGWRDAGHAKARLARQDIIARHPDRTINADLTLAPGPRLRFGPLTVQGNTDVRTDRIIEIAGLPSGQTYSPQELERAATRLRRTGTFRSVAMIEAETAGPDQTLPITVQLTEQPPRRFGFGAELSSLEGLTLSTFWLHRNLLGGAERLRIEGEIKGIGGESGGEDYRLAARFERPATFNEDTNFYTLAEIEQLDEVAFFSRQATIEAGIERIASDNRRYRFGLGLRRGQTRDAFGENTYTLFLVPLGVTFDYRDRALNATSGYYANAEITPFLAIDGAANGVRSYADLRAYRTFGDTRPITLAVRGQLGSVAGPGLSSAPADFLFYSGGGGTVRGQPYQALGVDLGGGNIVGGRSFVGLSAEVRVKTTGALGYVGFVDAGYIGSGEFPDGSGDWHSGAGVGIRYDTGIGPIRLDVAVPTSGPEADSNFQVYIGIGQAF